MTAAAQLDSCSPLPFAGAAFDVVALAASAGGLKALSEILSGLPASFPAAIAVVQHLDREHRSLLSQILARRTHLAVREAAQGDVLRPGTVFVAPPDQHLLLKSNGRICLSHAALVRFVRPSADLLFESVAASYKGRAIAVVLTGMGGDGSMGIKAIKQMGGMVLIQDPQTAEFRGMPAAALATGQADLVLQLDTIGPTLTTLVKEGRAA